MTVSRDAVVWAFRVVLGREPESEAGIAEHQRLADLDAVVETLLRSPEFRDGPRLKGLVRPVVEDTAARELPWRHQTRGRLRITLLGNCQVAVVGRALQALGGDIATEAIETTPTWLARLHAGEIDATPIMVHSDLVLCQRAGDVRDWLARRHPTHAGKLRMFPALTYAGFHPDCVYVRGPQGHVQGPTGDYHSSIGFWAWQQGLTVAQALSLFTPDAYAELGFYDYHESSRAALAEVGRRCELPLEPMLDRWGTARCWMHSVNHPKVAPLVDLAAALLRRESIEPIAIAPEWVDDRLAQWPVWPVYPGLAEAWGQAGGFVFKADRGLCPPDKPVLTLDLPRWLEASFQRWSEFPAGSLQCARTADPVYAGLRRHVRDQPAEGWRAAVQRASRLWTRADVLAHGDGPYVDLPDTRYWRRSVEQVPADAVDPVVSAPFTIGRGDKVATAGSCFAQHISRTLQKQGFAFLDTEPAPPGLSAEDARARQHGVYSARFGNLYTARQLVQLFDRAHGDFHPLDHSWQTATGRFADAFRPQIEPEAHASVADVRKARHAHLAAVRQMFADLDVFVFTLGLTEAWRRIQDGAVFPLAPGVVAGQFDPQRYEFVNFAVHEVVADLRAFLERLRRVNPRSRVILTVSPVPLIATYEDRHVLVSTIHSKSVLRAAAGEVAASEDNVVYFPSYEIITGPQARGAYFAEDLRSVTPEGVAHVMRLFLKHFTGEAPAAPARRRRAAAPAVVQAQRQELDALNSLVCDEEAIDRHRR